MPRSRGSEVTQRQSPRVPLHLKTTVCSEANGVVRHSVDRSPKLDDRRSPRSPLHHDNKKRGTRVTDLEVKLMHTQDELKKLKEQLAAAEAAKSHAQKELEETKKQIPNAAKNEDSVAQAEGITKEDSELQEPAPADRESINSPATDVFEVASGSSIQTESVQTDEVDSDKQDGEEAVEKEEVETKAMIEEAKIEQKEGGEEGIKASCMDLSELNAKLSEKEKEIEALIAEKEGLMKQVEEAKEKAMASQAKEEEATSKASIAEEELREVRKMVERLKEQLEAAEAAKESLEVEMRRLRMQTDQWRKAAEAAAAVLSTGEDRNGRKVGERCGSMDKHIGGGGSMYANPGFVGSPGMGESEEDGSGGGKRRSTGGMKMFGDLWRKKGQK